MSHRLVLLIRRLRASTDAVSVIEFAFVLPLLMFFGLGGLELANLAVTHMRVAQIAVSLADNASRAKQETVGGAPKFREFDANQSFLASQLQSGSLDFKKNGRLILSSLERNASGGQWIHWQRCYGQKTTYTSAYGPQGTGATGTAFLGMGPAASRVTAEAGTAVMFVEAVYVYQPLFIDGVYDVQVIRKSSAMYVRDDRDLTNIYNPSPTSTPSSC